MRLLYVLRTTNPDFGGPLEGSKEAVNEFRRLGHQADVLTLDSPIVGPSFLGSYGYTPKLTSWLASHRDNYDAVIVNGLWLYQSVGSWRGLRSGKTPYFLYTHGGLNPWFQRTYPAKHLKKRIYWKALEHCTLRDARSVIFTAQAELDLARTAFSPFSCDARVVPFCAAAPPAEIPDFRAKFPELRDKRIVLFLGRLHPVKGCDLLIQAFTRVAKPDLHLVIVGPGPADPLKRLAQSLGRADSITWTGPLYGIDKWSALAAAGFFVACSHCESFCVSAVEALACGIPIGISNQVNIWRDIVADAAGFAAPDTVDGATALLERWLGSSPSDLETLRANARRCYTSRYTAQHMVARLLELLK